MHFRPYLVETVSGKIDQNWPNYIRSSTVTSCTSVYNTPVFYTLLLLYAAMMASLLGVLRNVKPNMLVANEEQSKGVKLYQMRQLPSGQSQWHTGFMGTCSSTPWEGR